MKTLIYILALFLMSSLPASESLSLEQLKDIINGEHSDRIIPEMKDYPFYKKAKITIGSQYQVQLKGNISR